MREEGLWFLCVLRIKSSTRGESRLASHNLSWALFGEPRAETPKENECRKEERTLKRGGGVLKEDEIKKAVFFEDVRFECAICLILWRPARGWI